MPSIISVPRPSFAVSGLRSGHFWASTLEAALDASASRGLERAVPEGIFPSVLNSKARKAAQEMPPSVSKPTREVGGAALTSPHGRLAPR